jgi:hypothetical protein
MIDMSGVGLIHRLGSAISRIRPLYFLAASQDPCSRPIWHDPTGLAGFPINRIAELTQPRGRLESDLATEAKRG